MKVFIVAVLVLVAAITGTAGYILGTTSKPPTAKSSQEKSAGIGDNIKLVLDKKLAIVVELAKDPALIKEVQKTNKTNEKLTQALINQMDQNWRKSSADSATIKPFLTNALALELRKFEQAHPYLTEIFVADSRGLNAGQTNKTSDYFQADEDWWIQSYNSGKGKAFYGDIEFDDSSQTEGIALYAPVYDSTSGQAIGVIKAVLDLDSVRVEL